MIKNIGQTSQTLSQFGADQWINKADRSTKESQSHFELDPMKEFENVSKNSQSSELSNIEGASFGEFLSKSINEVNSIQQQANVAMEKLATGKTKNIHETMILVEQADIAFKTMNQIRAKVIDAYREIMRMQI